MIMTRRTEQEHFADRETAILRQQPPHMTARLTSARLDAAYEENGHGSVPAVAGCTKWCLRPPRGFVTGSENPFSLLLVKLLAVNVDIFPQVFQH